MKIYISGSNLSFLTKKKEVLEKRDILKENNHSVVLGCELKNKFLEMYRREPTPEELKSFKREILSECEGIMFLSLMSPPPMATNVGVTPERPLITGIFW